MLCAVAGDHDKKWVTTMGHHCWFKSKRELHTSPITNRTRSASSALRQASLSYWIVLALNSDSSTACCSLRRQAS